MFETHDVVDKSPAQNALYIYRQWPSSPRNHEKNINIRIKMLETAIKEIWTQELLYQQGEKRRIFYNEHCFQCLQLKVSL